MAKFEYEWQGADRARRRGEIEAESREAAFAALRAQGIRAIRVEPKGWETGRGYKGSFMRTVVASTVAAVLAGLGVWWFAKGTDARVAARPLARQRIPGDRARIEGAAERMFSCGAERFLARYAEPGRLGEPGPGMKSGSSASGGEFPSDGEFRECLEKPIMIAPDDFTEWIDLKRIVEGMKREMRAYLAGGGSAREYCSELAKRQRLEASYRERAEHRLGEMLAAAAAEAEDEDAVNFEKARGARLERRAGASRDGMRKAYEYWLKANAQLEAMGIWPLPLPDALRAYQMDLDVDE